MFIYIGKFNPWNRKSSNGLEFFNEASTLVLSYHLMMFTDFYTDLEVRYSIVGISLVYYTFFMIAANMMIIGVDFFQQSMRLRKWKQSRERYMK